MSLLIGLLAGCVARPQVNLAAADAMDHVAQTFETALTGFHSDLEALDGQRRKAVIEAFVARVQDDHEDERALALHSGAFTAALDRIEADRRTAQERAAGATDAIQVLREVAAGLRRDALQSMNLADEAVRYFDGVLTRARNQPQSPEGGIK